MTRTIKSAYKSGSAVSNWAGNVSFLPSDIERPSSVDDIVALVRKAKLTKQRIRLIGSGHSFTPVCETKDLLMTLHSFRGVESIDEAKKTAVVRAGTYLHELGKALFDRGFSQENLGDIDHQSIAGAFITGTHGTGGSLGCLATQLEAVELVDGLGNVKNVSRNRDSDFFQAVRVSLGALGIVTRVTLRLLPAYVLDARSMRGNLTEVLSNLPQLVSANRHFEFYWIPWTDVVQHKASNLSNEKPRRGLANLGVAKFVQDTVIENGALYTLLETAHRFPSKAPTVAQTMGKLIGPSRRLDAAHRVFATERWVRFREMEYSIPREACSDALRKMDETIRAKKIPVAFPVEVRFVKGDDIWLSPATGRDSCFIAVHQYIKSPHQEYFGAMEEILSSFDGRPHWGKMHTQSLPSLSAKYSHMQAFQRVRDQADPHRIFSTPYIDSLFGA